ncbi:unnamed protein product [Notodromas monacha]|uniref:G-protein coupled receptors family 1 profile domain-containing protein n=1 Tax=Notodromas monacha TaxID=399045 RepID=A0A7R9G7I4_9CRUS|nr:unnamed protein product [Notodromas monacha]CAG0912245.1 unnamed protein product [Notodromas monacha]
MVGEIELAGLFESRDSIDGYDVSKNLSDYEDRLVSGLHFSNFSNLDWFNSSNMSELIAENSSTETRDAAAPKPAYLFLVFLLFSVFTVFGNVLVILSVCRERALQTVTNYFVVSLAVADVLVAAVPMPFGVYVLVSPTKSRGNPRSESISVSRAFAIAAALGARAGQRKLDCGRANCLA